MRILIISEDEFSINSLKKSLARQRHVVDWASDVQSGWRYLESNRYELIVLSLLISQTEGISFCTQMRSRGHAIPILLITGADACQAGIKGLDAGADDYISEPLNFSELNARIRALSRRKQAITQTVININGLSLNPIACQVSYRHQPIELTVKEYNILELFLRNPRRVYSRAQILDLVWTFENPPSEESVKTHIQGLRKKLKRAGIVDWIKNVYGIGYVLNPIAEEAEKYSVAKRLQA